MSKPLARSIDRPRLAGPPAVRGREGSRKSIAGGVVPSLRASTCVGGGQCNLRPVQCAGEEREFVSVRSVDRCRLVSLPSDLAWPDLRCVRYLWIGEE